MIIKNKIFKKKTQILNLNFRMDHLNGQKKVVNLNNNKMKKMRLIFGTSNTIRRKTKFKYNKKVPQNENSSEILALMNYDWQNISASDIIKLFSS